MEKKSAKYAAVCNAIREWISDEELAAGDRLPSEDALARRFQVSRPTIRHAVGILVQEGWLSRQQGRGTFVLGPGRSPAAPSKLIGVIVTYINNYIFPNIISGIERRLAQDGYSLVLQSTGNRAERERTALETMRRRGVEGLIVEPSQSMLPAANRDEYRLLEQSGVPVLMLHTTYDEVPMVSVTLDDVAGGRLAARHLLDLGHQAIGLVMKLDDKQGPSRLEGFVAGMSERSVPFAARWTRLFTTATQEQTPGFYADLLEGADAAERPTAVFCYNDEMAARLIRELEARGLSVPGDLSVMGYDDSNLARIVNGGLTSIIHPKADMGYEAAARLLRMIRQERVEGYTFAPELVVRGSTQRRLARAQELSG